MAGVISFKFASDALGQIGQYKQAAAEARKEIRNLEREAKQASKTTGVIPVEMQRKIQEASAKLDRFSKLAKAEGGLERAEKAAKFFRTLDRAQSIRAIATEGITARAIGELLSDDKIEKALKKVGLRRLAGVMNAVGGAAGLGIFAYEQFKETYDRVQREEKDAQSVGRRYGSGQISRSEYDFFQARQNGGLNYTGSPIEGFNNAEKAARGILQLPEDKRDKLFGPAVNQRINTKITLEEERLKRALTPEERNEVAREAIFSILNQENLQDGDALVKKISEEVAKHVDTEIKRRKNAAELYNENRERAATQFLASAHDKRFSAAAAFGSILHIGD